MWIKFTLKISANKIAKLYLLVSTKVCLVTKLPKLSSMFPPPACFGDTYIWTRNFCEQNREKLQKSFTLSRKITWRIVDLAPLEHNFLPSGEHLEQLLLSAGFCLEPWQRIAKRNSSAISLQRLCLSFIAFFREFQQNSRIATIIASAKPQRRTTKTPPIFWTLKGWAFESLLLSWKIVLDQQTNITKCNWC